MENIPSFEMDDHYRGKFPHCLGPHPMFPALQPRKLSGTIIGIPWTFNSWTEVMTEVMVADGYGTGDVFTFSSLELQP